MNLCPHMHPLLWSWQSSNVLQQLTCFHALLLLTSPGNVPDFSGHYIFIRDFHPCGFYHIGIIVHMLAYTFEENRNDVNQLDNLILVRMNNVIWKPHKSGSADSFILLLHFVWVKQTKLWLRERTIARKTLSLLLARGTWSGSRVLGCSMCAAYCISYILYAACVCSRQPALLNVMALFVGTDF